ncbi:MAG: hypothetical protein HKO92_00565 [Flavobacteriaceae bacterium]|nr:hypothetical protein [Flavobacteriaceae bacterium]
MNNTQKPNAFFWLIGIIALLWNIMGVVAYLGQAYMTDEILKTLPEADQAWYSNVPAWVTAAFAIAVFSGLIACIGLLLKKKWCVMLFMISFIAVIIQQIYNFFLQDFVELTGQRLYMPIIVVIIAGFLMWYAKGLKEKGILS